MDATGLQTFPEAYEQTIPLGTLSQWGWHTAPNPDGWSIDRFAFKEFDSHGRMVGYADIPGERTPEIELAARQPAPPAPRADRLPADARGRLARPRPPTSPTSARRSTSGTASSSATSASMASRSTSRRVCHPTLDARRRARAGRRCSAPGRVAIEFRFPYGTGQTTRGGLDEAGGAPRPPLTQPCPDEARFARTLDARHVPRVGRGGRRRRRWRTPARTRTCCRRRPARTTLAFTVGVHADAGRGAAARRSTTTRAAARAHWNRFWSTGGAIDLSGSTDPRWRELERRIVLSQYLTAIQCAGRFPPQEIGPDVQQLGRQVPPRDALVARGALRAVGPPAAARAEPRLLRRDPAEGAGHGRAPGLRRRALAEDDEPDGRRVAVERRAVPRLAAAAPDLLRRTRVPRAPDRATLERFRDVVFETAEFMASFPAWDAQARRYVLGPPLQVRAGDVSEGPHDQLHVRAELLGLGPADGAGVARAPGPAARGPSGTACCAASPTPVVADGKYLFAETAPDTYSNPRWATDHPSVVAALGVLPGAGHRPRRDGAHASTGSGRTGTGRRPGAGTTR